MSRAKVAKDMAVFTGSSLVIQTINLVLAFYIRRLLGPEAMGVWALMQVIGTYVAYSNLGIVAGVCREIPALRAAGGQEARIAALKNGAYTYIQIVALLSALGLAAAAFILRGSISEELFWGLLVLAGMTHLDRKNSYRLQVLYSEKRFSLASRFRLYSSLVNAALVVVLVRCYGLYGFFAANLLSFAFNAWYLTARSSIRFEMTREWRAVRGVLLFGAPMFLLQFGFSFFNSIDKVAIGKFLGIRELGIYSLAMMAASYVFMLPNMFQVVLLPWTLETFGRPEDEEARRKYAVVPGRLMVAYFSLCIGVLWILAPSVLAKTLDQYASGVPAMKAALFGACFAALSQQMTHIVLGYKRHVSLLPYLALFSGAAFAAAGAWTKSGGGLTEIAVLAAGFQLLFYVVVWCIAFRGFFSAPRMILEIALNLAPLAVSALSLAWMDRSWLSQSPAALLLKTGVYGLLWIGIIGVFEKRIGFFSRVRSAISGWRAGRASAQLG